MIDWLYTSYLHNFRVFDTIHTQTRTHIQIYDSRNCRTFVGEILYFVVPVRNHRPQNRSDIPMTGYDQVRTQIQAYLDSTTQFILTSSNPAWPTGDIWKNTGTKRGWSYSIYSCDQHLLASNECHCITSALLELGRRQIDRFQTLLLLKIALKVSPFWYSWTEVRVSVTLSGITEAFKTVKSTLSSMRTEDTFGDKFCNS